MMTIMRYDDAHKETVHKRIVDAAAKAFRKHGLDGVSIPGLMKKVGLTHGGFYSHFEDRDALVAEAILAAASESANGVFGEGVSLEESLRRYLSTAHVDHPEQGCVVAAVGTDAARQSAPIRRAFSEVARGILERVEAKLHPKKKSPSPSDEALRLASTMVGAVLLARTVADEKLAERILKAARATN